MKNIRLENGYIIRKFRPEDLDKVVEINRLCLPENYAPSFFLDLYRSSPETFSVAEYGGEIAGYITVRIEYGLSDFHRFRLAKKGHIVSIAVRPQHRMKGVASTLILTVMEAMSTHQHCHETFLEVRVSNKEAISLYTKLGFKEIRKTPGYYIDGETATIMVRELPSNLRA